MGPEGYDVPGVFVNDPAVLGPGSDDSNACTEVGL